MPKNSRPWIFDPYYEKSSLKEIQEAQNQWDLLNEQEKANRLAEEKLQQEKELERVRREEERENAELIAEATKQAEQERYENEQNIEKQRQQHNEKMEELRQKNDEINRYLKLCDNIGMNFEEIMKFLFLLNNAGSREDITEKNKLTKEAEIHYNKVQEFKDSNSEIDDIQELIKQKEEYLEILTRQYSSKKELFQEQESRNKPKQEEKKKKGFFSNIFGNNNTRNEDTIDLGIKINLNISQDELLKMETEIEELKKEIDKYKKIYEKQSELPPEIEEEWNKFIDIAGKRTKISEKIKEYLKTEPNFKKFNEFRKEHYNNEVENLFRKLDIGLDYIRSEDIKNNGTIDDYSRYISDFIYDEIYKSLLEEYKNYSYEQIRKMREENKED